MNEVSHLPPLPMPVLGSSERLQCLMEAAEEYAIITLDPSACVIDWDLGAERLIGWRRQDVIGRPVATLLPGLAIHEQATQMAECICKDGSRLPAQVTIKSFRNASGTV